MKYLGSWSFYECTGLTRIDIPANVEIIGTEAFEKCTNLTGVYIKDLAKWCGVKFGNYQYQGSNFAPSDKISNPLFYGKKLYLNGELITDLVIPDGVEAIETFTFEGASEITSLTVPSSVTSIGKSAFSYCHNLKSITLPSTITDMQRKAFAYLNQESTNYHASQNKNNVKVYINDLTTWVKNSYGAGFEDLTSQASNPIKLELFVGGDRASDIVIPESVTDIGQYTFYAVSMNSVVLHKNVEKVNSGAFSESTLKTIYSQSKFAPDIYYGTNSNQTQFGTSTLTAIYVPVGKATAYKNKWTGHEAIIKEADTEVKGEQTIESIAEAKEAVRMVYGKEADYIDLTGATLDGSITAETLKAGDTSSNVLYYLPTGSAIEGDNIVIDGVATSVSLTDGEPDSVPKEFTATTLTNNRAIAQSETNAYTLCLPYDYTLPAGLKAYELKEKDSNGNLVFTEAASIKANEPYLVVASENISNLNAANVTMQVTPDEMENKGTTEYEFRGTLQTIGNEEAATMGAYILQANKEWHPVKTEKPSAYILAGRAYLVPTSGGAPMFLSIIGDNSATNIRLVSSDGSEQYYDLQGHRLEKPVKGVNIVNGKKVVVK